MRLGVGLTPAGAAVGRLLSTAAPLMPIGSTVTLLSQDAPGRYNVVRNRAEPAPLPDSLWGHPRPGANRLVVGAFGGTGVTVTKDGVGGDGKAVTIRMTFAAGAAASPTALIMGVNSNFYPGARVLPAGTYTLSFTHRSANGVEHTASFANEGGGVGSSPAFTIPADGVERTFSWTFTLASEQVLRQKIQVSTGTLAGDLIFDNFRLVPGAAAGAVPAGDRHITKVGRFALSGQAISLQAQTSNAVGTEGHAFVLRDAGGGSSDVSEMTAAFAIRMAPGIDPAAATYVLLSNGAAPSGRIELAVSAGNLIWQHRSEALTLSHAGVDQAGWTTVVVRGSAAGLDIFLDGLRFGSSTTPWASTSAKEWHLFGRNYQLAFPGSFISLDVFERRLSDAEVLDAHRALKQRIADAGEAYAEPAASFIAEGASNTAGQSYIRYCSRLFAKRLNFVNFAVPGSGLGVPGPAGASIWGREALWTEQINRIKAAGRTPVFTLLCGSNDGPSIQSDPVAYAARHQALWEHIRSLGAIMVPATLTAFQQGQSAAYPSDEQYDAFNASLRARAQAGGYAIADFAATSLGRWNSTDYADLVHMNATGHQKAAEVLRATLATLPALADRA